MTLVLIEKELKGSPMEGSAEYYLEAGKKYDIDPLFLVAIGHHESHYAKAYSDEANNERHNYAGVMTFHNGVRYLREYGSWKEAIFDHARIIKTLYIDQGKKTIEDIWLVYAPPLEITNDSWGPSVARKYTELLNNFK
jgi:hypothetical protein